MNQTKITMKVTTFIIVLDQGLCMHWTRNTFDSVFCGSGGALLRENTLISLIFTMMPLGLSLLGFREHKFIKKTFRKPLTN